MSWLKRRIRKITRSVDKKAIGKAQAMAAKADDSTPDDVEVVAPPEAPPPTPAQERQIRTALAEGIVTREVLRDELRRGGAQEDSLGRALLGLPYPSIAELAAALLQDITPRIDPDRIPPTAEALSRVPPEVARRLDALPLRLFGTVLCVAMPRPEDLAAIEELRRITGLRVKVLRANGDAVRERLRRHYPDADRSPRQAYRLRAIPVDEATFESAFESGGEAATAVAEWEAIWLHGDILAAEPAER